MTVKKLKCDNYKFGQPIKLAVMGEGLKQGEFLIESLDGIQKGDL